MGYIDVGDRLRDLVTVLVILVINILFLLTLVLVSDIEIHCHHINEYEFGKKNLNNNFKGRLAYRILCSMVSSL